jgi:hypothetical protein
LSATLRLFCEYFADRPFVPTVLAAIASNDTIPALRVISRNWCAQTFDEVPGYADVAFPEGEMGFPRGPE